MQMNALLMGPMSEGSCGWVSISRSSFLAEYFTGHWQPLLLICEDAFHEKPLSPWQLLQISMRAGRGRKTLVVPKSSFHRTRRTIKDLFTWKRANLGNLFQCALLSDDIVLMLSSFCLSWISTTSSGKASSPLFSKLSPLRLCDCTFQTTIFLFPRDQVACRHFMNWWAGQRTFLQRTKDIFLPIRRSQSMLSWILPLEVEMEIQCIHQKFMEPQTNFGAIFEQTVFSFLGRRIVRRPWMKLEDYTTATITPQRTKVWLD